MLRRGEGEASGETDLALRYDLTVPLARVVAEHRGKLPKFFKRYQIQPVWRADRPARGRFREFYQCDVDAMGSTSPVVEAELCAAVTDVLIALGFDKLDGGFVLRLNHREVLRALLVNAGVPPDQQAGVLVSLDKLDKIGEQGVFNDLATRGIDGGTTTRLFNWLNAACPGDSLEWLEKEFSSLGDPAAAGFANLRAIRDLANVTAAGRHLRFEPSLARGLTYYTGAIMEISVPGIGSLGGGGRYDGLVGMFSGEDIPASGFSLGLERILVVMAERNMFEGELAESGPDVLVTIFDEDLAGESLKLAGELRAAGLSAETYPAALRGGKDLGKAFKYADARQARFVTVVGQDEFRNGEVKIRNMKTGDQQAIARGAVADVIAAASRLALRTSDLASRPSPLAPRASDTA